MSILQRSEWAVENASILLALHGYSGSGKTLSSLLLARGIAGPKGKIGIIDTERRRAKLHANYPGIGAVEYAELSPPFAPERYVEALEEMFGLGLDVLIVDSLSHEWEGEGGVLEIADQAAGKGLQKWNKPKARHKKFMRTLFRAPCHLITCFRSKRKFVQRVGADGKDEIVNIGAVPVQEFGFIYETTAQLYLPTPEEADDGRGRGVPRVERCPDSLLPYLGAGEQITIDTGKAIGEWLAKGKVVDRGLQDLIAQGRTIAGEGVEPLREWWQGLKKSERQKLAAEQPNLKSIAETVDAERSRGEEAARETAAENKSGGPFDWNAYMVRIKQEIDMAAPHGEAMVRKVLARELQNMTDAPAEIGRMIREHAQQMMNPKGRKP